MMINKSRKVIFSIVLITVIIIIITIPWPGLFFSLQIKQLSNNNKIINFPFIFSHPFSISYINSIYIAPVLEKYEINNTDIYLKEIITNSWAVVEYYNIVKADISKKGNGEICICNLNYHQPHILMIIGYVGKQKIIWEEQIYSLYVFAGPGEKVKIESISVSALQYFQRKIKSYL